MYIVSEWDKNCQVIKTYDQYTRYCCAVTDVTTRQVGLLLYKFMLYTFIEDSYL